MVRRASTAVEVSVGAELCRDTAARAPVETCGWPTMPTLRRTAVGEVVLVGALGLAFLGAAVWRFGRQE